MVVDVHHDVFATAALAVTGRVMPYIDEVDSTRTATTLLGALDQLDTERATPSVRKAPHSCGMR